MFQQPHLGKTVIYHSGRDRVTPGQRRYDEDRDFAAVVTFVYPPDTARDGERYRVDLAVFTGDSQEPVRQINGVKYGMEGGTYGWTDAAR